MTEPYSASIHPGSPVPSPTARPRNPLAIPALVGAGLSVLVGLSVQFAIPVMLSAGGYQAFMVVSLFSSIFRVVVALAAIVMALLGLSRDGGRALLGAALGIAIVEVILVATGLVSTMIPSYL